MRAVAIVAIRNEELHVARCLRDLIANGIEVILIDNDSEDQSVRIATEFLGRGLLSIERLPWNGVFSLKTQLEAKAKIIAGLSHDWVLHVDADEWFCPPWPQTRLIEAIERVDSAGYECINFDEMTFVPWPHEDFCRPDYARHMTTYYFFEPHKLRLMRAWKRSAQVNNIEEGGHRLNRPVAIFPENFILRHYIALSPEYLFRKYHRRAFAPEELAIGWHHHPQEYRRIDITLPMCMLRPSPFLKALQSWSSIEFDKSSPARVPFWHWC
jgi:glycosyltransferase involved in cell wall biosynthesis